MAIVAVCLSDEQLQELVALARKHHQGNVSGIIREALASNYETFDRARKPKKYVTGAKMKDKRPK